MNLFKTLFGNSFFQQQMQRNQQYRNNYACCDDIDEYRKYIEKDPALERRFSPVDVSEYRMKNCFYLTVYPNLIHITMRMEK